jgi:hypothetical protein
MGHSSNCWHAQNGRGGISSEMKWDGLISRPRLSKKPIGPWIDNGDVNSFGLIDGDFDDPEEYEKDVVRRLRERGAL